MACGILSRVTSLQNIHEHMHHPHRRNHVALSHYSAHLRDARLTNTRKSVTNTPTIPSPQASIAAKFSHQPLSTAHPGVLVGDREVLARNVLVLVADSIRDGLVLSLLERALVVLGALLENIFLEHVDACRDVVSGCVAMIALCRKVG
jgi:hypothetical protein